MTASHLILASTSKIRLTVLQNAGLGVICLPPELDEETAKIKLGQVTPKALAVALAEQKALSLKNPEAWVIGADQTLSCNNTIFHKPDTLGKARQQLQELRGKTHTLHSSLAVAHGGKIIWSICEDAHLTMRTFSDDFLERYISENGADLLTSVGSYKLERSGVQLFEKIEGDYFTILGFPLLPFLSFLREQKILAT
jgi:septum formation protein